jgi:hypothetical protein
MHPNSSPTPRVERRAHGAKRWRDCSGDVLAWDGTVLRITTLPGNVMVKGAEWRVNGTVYQQRYLDTMRPMRVWLAPVGDGAEVV